MQAKFILALLASSLTHTVLATAAPGAGAEAMQIRQISPEIPTKSDANGNPVPFEKRSLNRRQPQIAAEIPTKSDANGNPVPFTRRSLNRREPQIAAEIPTKSDANGNPVPFKKTKREIEEAEAIIKRNPIAQIPAELPTRSGPDGIPVPFARR